MRPSILQYQVKVNYKLAKTARLIIKKHVSARVIKDYSSGQLKPYLCAQSSYCRDNVRERSGLNLIDMEDIVFENGGPEDDDGTPISIGRYEC